LGEIESDHNKLKFSHESSWLLKYEIENGTK